MKILIKTFKKFVKYRGLLIRGKGLVRIQIFQRELNSNLSYDIY